MRHLAAGSGETAGRSGWAQAWPDALAFVGGLTLAWFNRWETKDLVWSLWLSSLVVGYAMIVWTIFGGTLATFGANFFKMRHERVAPALLGGGAALFGGLFMLAFFTVHFGGFHFVHSMFLNGFFPMTETRGFAGWTVYAEVVREYWFFVVLAAVAERSAFKWPGASDEEVDDGAVTAQAINRRKRRNSGVGNDMMAPYKNVIRLHLLIFFFAFAHFARLDSFLVYAVVYAVYFFPWRLLGKRVDATAAA